MPAEEQPEFQRFILFHLEYARLLHRSPYRQSCLVINATDAGFAQLDMEMGKFLTDLIYNYYPDAVAVAYIYNLSWMLRSTFSMVTAVLPPDAHERIKFIQQEDLKSIIRTENILSSEVIVPDSKQLVSLIKHV